MREIVSAGGVIIEGPHMLLVEHTDGSLGFAKGQLEPGETEPEAAVREFGEETCRQAVVVRCLGTVSRKSVDYGNGQPEVVDKRVVIYLMEDDGPTGLPEESHTRPVWVTGEEALERMKHPEESEFLTLSVLPLVNVAASEYQVAGDDQHQAGD